MKIANSKNEISRQLFNGDFFLLTSLFNNSARKRKQNVIQDTTRTKEALVSIYIYCLTGPL